MTTPLKPSESNPFPTIDRALRMKGTQHVANRPDPDKGSVLHTLDGQRKGCSEKRIGFPDGFCFVFSSRQCH